MSVTWGKSEERPDDSQERRYPGFLHQDSRISDLRRHHRHQRRNRQGDHFAALQACIGYRVRVRNSELGPSRHRVCRRDARHPVERRLRRWQRGSRRDPCPHQVARRSPYSRDDRSRVRRKGGCRRFLHHKRGPIQGAPSEGRRPDHRTVTT